MIGYYTIYYINGESYMTFDRFLNMKDFQKRIELLSKSEDISFVIINRVEYED